MFGWPSTPTVWPTNAKKTIIQTSDASFAAQFAQCCAGHDYGHTPIEDGNVTANTAFYPKKIYQSVVRIWKTSDEATQKKLLKTFEESR